MDYNNKTVWITGASSGIGKSFAHAFYRAGARLILSSRRGDELARVRDELNADDSRCRILPLDLADADTLRDAAEHAIAEFGGVDVLVNNGGISQRSLFAETDIQTIRRLMEVNFFGSVALTRYVLPHMMEKKSGQIIVTSSVAGKFGTKYRSGYAASKHALHGMFDSIRQEMYEYGISVTLVCPGPIRTEITRNSLTADGSSYGKMGDMHTDAMDADEMVQRIWDDIRAEKDEIVVSGAKEKLAVLLKRFAPGLLNRILKNAKVT